MRDGVQPAAAVPLPATGFLREKQILGDRRADPPIPAIFPVSRSTWWSGVKSGRFPQPVKLGPATTAWRAEDILQFLANPAGYQAKDAR